MTPFTVAVLPVDGDRSAVGLHESANELQKYSLAAAVVADDAIYPALLQPHIDIFENRFLLKLFVSLSITITSVKIRIRDNIFSSVLKF